MEKIYAYLDESGNHNIDTSKSGSSNFFIICAVLVTESNLESAYALAEKIRSDHFQTGEIKSSKIKPLNHERRKKILLELSELPVNIYIAAIDKSRIHINSGLQHKKTFIKHVNGILYQRLFSTCHRLKMTVDEHGSEDFQNSLKGYVEKRYISDLFDDSDFQTKSSKDDVLIQVADFFAGTIAHIYEDKVSKDIEEVYKLILQRKALGIIEWPPKYRSFIGRDNAISIQNENLIYETALNQADRFIEKNSKMPDEEQRLQLCILEYLRFTSEFVSDDYITLSEIHNHLKERGFTDLNDQKIRLSGIAKLRDERVIIASAQKGYKLPKNQSDIIDFLEFASVQVLPRLDRVMKARDVFLLSSGGKFDILEHESFSQLRVLISKLQDS